MERFPGQRFPDRAFAKMLMDEGVRVLDAGELPKIILKNETENVNQTDLQRH